MRHYRMAFQNLKKPISRSICIIILEIRTAINISIKQSIVFLPFFMYNDFGKGPNHGRRTLRGGADVGQALFPLVPSIGQRLGKRCGGFMRNQKNEPFPFGKKLYTIGEFSKLYHIGTDTLRYYEEKGLLSPDRGENGYRYYSAKSIWRMNVILNLRRLGFSVDRIREYFQNRTVDTTESLIDEELALIRRQIAALQELRQSVEEQRSIIEETRALVPETVRRLALPPRNAFVIRKPYDADEDMDLLMRQLLDRSKNSVFMIGNNRLASILAPEDAPHQFEGALLFDPKGTFTLPGGAYLSICYAGATASRSYAGKLSEYAVEHGLVLTPPFIDLVWIDIHTSENDSEHLSELQVRIQAEDPET